MVQNIELVHIGFFLLFDGVPCPGKPQRDLLYFTFTENDTGNDASTSQLKITFSLEGVLILLPEGINTRMSQTGHTHHQARLTGWRCSLYLPIVVTIATLKPECISMTIADETSYTCANLGVPLNNMNLAEGNTTTVCETQPTTNEGKFIYTLSSLHPLKNRIAVKKPVAAL